MLAGIFTSGAFGYLFDYLIWWLLLISLFVHTWCFFQITRSKNPLQPPLRERGPGPSPLTKGGFRGVFRLLIGNALIFACMLGVLAMAAETYLRFVAVYTDSFGVSLPARRWFALHTKLNSLGCRDKEWSLQSRDDQSRHRKGAVLPDPDSDHEGSVSASAKQAGVQRIAFVGDSFTYGWGIERVEDRFTDLLQAEFDRVQPGAVEVMNVAKPGWGTGDQIQPIRDMIEHYGVDEIVLCYVPNDIEKLIPTTEDFNPTRPPDYFFFNLDSSPLLDYLYRRLYLPFVPTVRGYHDWLASGFADPQIWSRHVEQFSAIARHCHDHNVKLRVVLLPFLRTSGEKFDQPAILKVSAAFETLAPPLQGGIEGGGSSIPPYQGGTEGGSSALLGRDSHLGPPRAGIPFRETVINLLPILQSHPVNELVVNSFDAHPNEKAHKLIVEALWTSFDPADGWAPQRR